LVGEIQGNELSSNVNKRSKVKLVNDVIKPPKKGPKKNSGKKGEM